MQIKTIPKSLFTSMEVQGLGDSVVQIIETDSQKGHPILQALLQTLRQSLEVLAQSRLHTNHNTQTDSVEEADLVRDYAFRAFWMMIEAGTMRRQEVYRTAAQVVMTHFKPFDRRLHTFGYDKETTALKDFIAEMEKEDVTQALNAMQMQEWLQELKEAQLQFLQVYEGKINEETQKQALIPTKEAREQVVNQLIAITQTINGLMMSGLENFGELSARIESLVEDFESKARARKTRKKKAYKSEDDI